MQADKALLDTVFDGVVVVDLKSLRISLANRAAAAILGFDDPEELVGIDPLKHVPLEDRERVTTMLSGLVSGSCLQAGAEIKVLGKRGKEVWIMARGVKLASNGNSVLLGSFRDITAEKTAEMARREAEERQIDLLNSSNELILISQDWKIVFANRRLQEATGLSGEALTGMSILDITHPDDRNAVAERYRRTLDGEFTPSSRAFKGIGKDGKTAWGMMRHVPFTWQGKPALMTVIQDITQQKLAEEALRESEARYRMLAENASDVIWTTDMNLKYTYNSPSKLRQSGYTPEEFRGLTIDQVLTPESLQIAARVFEEELAIEQLPDRDPHRRRVMELAEYHKNGSIIWTEATASFLRDKDGKAIGVIGISRDITERKKAEKALQESEEKFKALVENAAAVVFSLDTQGNIVYMSPGIERLSGFKAEEVIGTSCIEYVVPEDLPGLMASMEKTIAGELEPYEFRVGNKNGTLHHVLTSSRPIYRDGNLAGLIGVMVDVTERKSAEEALRASEANYRDLFEHTMMGMAVVDAETMKVVLANHSMAGMFGFKSPEDMVGTEPLEYVLPEDLDLVVGELAKALADPSRHEVATWRARTEDGRVIWVTGMSTPFEYVCRPSVLLSLADVTAAKEAELKTAESEEKNRLLVDNAAEGIIVVQDGVLKFVNPKCVEISGYSTGELLSRSFLEVVHPDDRQTIVDNYVRRLSGEEAPNNYRFRIVDKAGVIKWLQINTVQFSWEGEPAVLSMLNDVTERRQAEEALQESEERFRALIEGARDAIAVIDLKGKVTYSSPSAERMTGGGVDNLMTMNLQERLHPDDVGKATSIFESLMKSPDGTVVDVELRYRRDDESWGVIEARGTNRVHDPKIGGIVVNYRDITERRQAEEAFRDSESRYRLLAENVSDVIWSVNLRTRRSFFSPSITRVLGYTVEEAQSMKAKEVVSPTSYPKAIMAFSKLSTKNGNGSGSRSSSTQLELELMRKDGSFIWADISVTLLRDSEGQPSEVFGVMRDVTQRKKVEEDLRTSEEYFRALIENAWDAIAIVNAEGTMLYESPSSARILGYEPEEIVGRNLADFVRPEDIAAIAGTFRRFRTEPGSIVMVDAGFRHKDGHYIECEGTLQNFLHDPKINGVVANYRDVTDRRRAEEAIRTSEERFRNLVEATSDWVWEVDRNGIYTYASPNVRDVMGYDVGEVIGKSISDFMPAREASRFSRTFKAHAAKKDPFTFVESSRLHKDGRVIVMETSGVPFLGDDGGLLGYRGIGRDITSRKKVEKDLENSLKKVEKTMEAAIQAISYTMETRDPYTTGHQRRVTQLACAIAKEMGVAPWQIDGIRVAGLLHDIGKIAVPTEILSKPGKLSDIEFSMIKAHPKVGFDILKNVEFEWPIARIVVQHHERLNGSGYPFGLSGKDILQESRILAVADVVEAMSSHRPYRPALGIDKALAEVVRGDGTLYDSEVVRACATVIKERGFKFEG